MESDPNLCDGCIHLKRQSYYDELEAGPLCSAFPGGIPPEIFYGGGPHFTVRDGQVGEDVFEPNGEFGKKVLQGWKELNPDA